MASAAHDVRVLNGLIETVLDSADGYDEAAKDAGGATYAAAFVTQAADRREAATMLQAEVARLGGDPEDDGSFLAAAHRVFVDLRDSLTRGDKGVIDEVVRGEGFLKDKFQRALDDTELTGEIRDRVLQVYDHVKAGHDRMLQLQAELDTAG